MANEADESKPLTTIQKQVPLGIKVISVWYYICAVLNFLGAILFFGLISFMSNPLDAMLPEFARASTGVSLAGTISTIMMVMSGIFFLAFAILSYCIGRDLRKLKKWARITVLIITGIGSASSLAAMIMLILLNQNIQAVIVTVSLGISLLIFLYLLIMPKVKEAFS